MRKGLEWEVAFTLEDDTTTNLCGAGPSQNVVELQTHKPPWHSARKHDHVIVPLDGLGPNLGEESHGNTLVLHRTIQCVTVGQLKSSEAFYTPQYAWFVQTYYRCKSLRR